MALSNTMLEFLFIAETYNGNIIRQTQEDVSVHNPSKSAFYDILKENVKRFSLVGKGHMITVDLTTGLFEYDGRTIYPPKMPPEKVDLQLIYYRQVQQRQILGPEGSDILQPITRYYIGWQAHHKGKNYKFELGID